MTLEAGQIVDRYTVVGLLGSGGMADVYEVRHNLLRSSHALKVLRTRDPEVAERLLLEGRVQAGLRHPHVLTVTDLVDIAGAPGLVMELVRGPSLHEWLRHGDLDLAEAAALARDITDGVHAAHRAGVVHRDLKPANVLLDTSSRRVIPKVGDFGLVQSIDASSSRLAGSPAFMAPEQARGDDHQDHRADAFSLGSLLYELFTGQRAYVGSNRVLVERLASGELPDFSPVPEAVRALIRGLMRPDPAERLGLSEVLAPMRVLAGDTSDLAERIGGHGPTLELDAPATDSISEATLDVDDLMPELPALTSLPEGVTLLGRDVELDELERLLTRGSLVTVLGPGGTGKTQLALAAAHDARSRHQEALFVDISQARDADHVRQAVARQLDCAEDRVERVLERRAPLRLVLDNAEQVVGPVASLADAWSRIRSVQVVVTSRERLRTASEAVLDLGPLDARAAIDLFESRARSAGAELGEQDHAVIAEIVERLDRLPLPIELAASRARALPLPRLLDRLADRLRTLAGAHRSLRAMLDQSWELLDEAERQALRDCAVFEGPFTLDAAEAVLTPAEAWTEDLLASLLDKSLVRRVGDRWSLFQTIREYVLDKGLDPETRTRHGAWFTQRVRDATDGLELPVDVTGIRSFRADMADLTAIVGDAEREPDHRGWALCGLLASAQVSSHSPLLQVGRSLRTQCSPAVADRLGHWLAFTAFRRGETEAAEAIASELHDADPPVLIRVLRLEGRIAARRGDLDAAHAYVQECRRQAEALGDDGLLTDLAISLGVSAWERGAMSEAREVLEGAQARVAGRDPAREMRVVHNLGILLHETEDAKLAVPLYERARAINDELGDHEFGAMAATSLAIAYADLGELDLAESLYSESIASNAAVGRVVGEAIAQGNRGNTLLELGRRDEARTVLRRSVRRARQADDERVAVYFESTLGLEKALDGDLDEAAALLDHAVEVLDKAQDVRGSALARVWRALVALHADQPAFARDQLGPPVPEDPGYMSIRQLIEDEVARRLDGREPGEPTGPETMERRLVLRHLAHMRGTAA
ncbi:MAG: tetratricopeptide repeat protein [Deltaproteobacteria bacterium]|nr:MAG: tetratricopeptide repeat protein [Deltaproteobacteria bacterium]